MILYKITNKIDGKIYIGQTVRSMRERWLQHCRQKDCRYLGNAIKKYGKDAFEVKILTRCNNIQEMNHREEYYIKLFNTIAPNGYNLLHGGNNRRHHEETKKKLKKAITGHRHSDQTKIKMSIAQKGKHHTEITKIKMRKPRSDEFRKNLSLLKKGKSLSEYHKSRIRENHWSKKGLPGNRKGVILCEEIRRKMSTSHKGHIISEETRAKISKAFDSKKIKIQCIETGEVFESQSLAARKLNLNLRGICNTVKGVRKTVNGYSFRKV